MIEIREKSKCTGCGACVNLCPNNSIFIKEDFDGFGYPTVDLSTCLNCHLCEHVCPLDNLNYVNREKTFSNVYFSGQLRDKSELSEVSSGGAAWGLAESIIDLGGVVYGAAQYDVDTIKHIRVETISDAKKIRRSKYFQSDIGHTYQAAKKDLENGRIVLFTGVGCQIAGLLSYLGRDYENLITADVICHGVPSKKAWRSYRNYIEKKYRSKVENIIFRDKSAGWGNNQYNVLFENGFYFKERSTENPFHLGYLLGLYNRPSCGECKFNFIPRVSDFTFADYWKYDGELFRESRMLGVSLICINSKKGKNNIPLLEKHLILEKTTEEKALDSARHLNNKPIENKCRESLLKELSSENFMYIWKKYISKQNDNLLKRIIRRVKRLLG